MDRVFCAALYKFCISTFTPTLCYNRPSDFLLLAEEIMNNLLADIALAIIGGVVGGLIANELAWRLFRKQATFQTQIQDIIQKRDALRDALALSYEIGAGLNVSWERLGEDDSDAANRLEAWRAQLNSAATLFPDSDQAQKGLFGLRNLIGISPARWQESGVDPFSALYDDQEILKQALAEINVLLES